MTQDEVENIGAQEALRIWEIYEGKPPMKSLITMYRKGALIILDSSEYKQLIEDAAKWKEIETDTTKWKK